MSHLIFQDNNLAGLRAAFLRQFKQAIQICSNNYENIVVALPGGRSVVPFLEELLEHVAEIDQAVWGKMHFFLVDERVVDPGDKESNFYKINENFLAPLQEKKFLLPTQMHPLNFSSGSVLDNLSEYSDQLKKLGGLVHVAIVGVGEDGHVASLFPHHPSLKISNLHFVLIENSPKPPATRVSMSVGLLKAAMQVFVLFIGEGKKDALLNYFNADECHENCPAKIFANRQNTQIFTNINIKI